MSAAYERFRKICLSLPETSEVFVENWGHPTFRVGPKDKMFASCSAPDTEPAVLGMKVEKAHQAALVATDKRYSVAAYVGKHGWINVDASERCRLGRGARACSGELRPERAQATGEARPVAMRIGVDIGGTFTDVVVFDDSDGAVRLAKSLSTPSDLARGVREALTRSEAPLQRAQSLIHGSTVVINAIIERSGARTALLTTRGFRDVYEIGRINRPESFNPRFRKHRPLVARENIFEIPERILADGSVRLPLNEDAGPAGGARANG